jgi:hypothetical protein
MPKKGIPTVANYFESVTDPRRENRRHKLIDVITIAICAVISNVDSYDLNFARNSPPAAHAAKIFISGNYDMQPNF